MGVITRNVLTGLITLIPVVLTFYLLYWLAVTTESALGGQLVRVLPDEFYRPGLGVVTGLVICFLVGMLMNNFIVRRVFARAERLFYRIPLVKQIYPALRDFMDYFSPVRKKDFQQVVMVTLAQGGPRALGLVTRSDLGRLPDGMNGSDQVLVYLPMSYMIGGYALFVPRAAIEPIDMAMDDAMRFVLTAGVTGAGAAPEEQRPAPVRPAERIEPSEHPGESGQAEQSGEQSAADEAARR